MYLVYRNKEFKSEINYNNSRLANLYEVQMKYNDELHKEATGVNVDSINDIKNLKYQLNHDIFELTNKFEKITCQHINHITFISVDPVTSCGTRQNIGIETTINL